MLRTDNYWVYILTNSHNNVLYTGVTNDIQRRMWEHRNHAVKGFTDKYNINKLVYLTQFNHISEAIKWEKRIKGWLRAKKIALIESFNPEWRDLSGSLCRF